MGIKPNVRRKHDGKTVLQVLGKARSDNEMGRGIICCLTIVWMWRRWLMTGGGKFSIRQRFIGMTGLKEQQTRAWLLFFIALHDYGKF